MARQTCIKKTLAAIVPKGVDAIIAGYDNPAEEILAIFRSRDMSRFKQLDEYSTEFVFRQMYRGGSHSGILNVDDSKGTIILQTRKPLFQIREGVDGCMWAVKADDGEMRSIGWMFVGDSPVFHAFIKSIKKGNEVALGMPLHVGDRNYDQVMFAFFFYLDLDDISPLANIIVREWL